MEELFNLNPFPWKYNPSSWNQRVRIALIALIAVFISVYLGLFQWGLINHVWDPIFGVQSENVLQSDVSHRMSTWFRVPDAILGSLAYLGDIIFALAGSQRRWQFRPWLVLIFGIDVIPLGIVSAILVFLQATLVGNWCFLCIITAIISLILVVLAYDEVLSSFLYLYRVWKKTRSVNILWKAFCGTPTQESYEVGEEMVKR
ncbi:MAG: vitamin K epoxide reductase family protein [Chlamydiales bacterium]